MDANACGVFATVIPVLLLAGYLSGHLIDLAVRNVVSAVVVSTWSVVSTVAEVAALEGVYHRGLGDQWAQFVVGAAIAAAGAVPVSAVSQIASGRWVAKEQGQREHPEDDAGSDGQ